MAETHRGFFAWLQDNARILLSIALVLFLLFAVYSYSKRSDNQLATDTQSRADMTTDDLVLDTNVTDAAVGDDFELVGEGGGPVDDAPSGLTGTDADTEVMEKTEPKIEKQVMEQKAMKKDGSIIVSAGNGDGMTHLARRATAEYISENNVDALNGAQKVYVEDYLRKSVDKTPISPGTELSFTNDSIATAIDKAQISQRLRLQILGKYASRVAAFQ